MKPMLRLIRNTVLLVCISSIAFSQSKKTGKQNAMKLPDWIRPYYEQSHDNNFFNYVVFGDFDVDFQISKSTYRFTGLPEGIDLVKQTSSDENNAFTLSLEGYAWNTLRETDPETAKKTEQSKSCFIISGDIKDSESLNGFRNIIGLITYLIDNGGVAVYDIQILKFWQSESWRTTFFDAQQLQPAKHVVILKSEQSNGQSWYHTRGMRKFGHPNLNIHNVTAEYETEIVELFNRFINFQALGGIIADKQEIKMNSLPEGMWCENKGDFEDPDFNNKHLEIHWQ